MSISSISSPSPSPSESTDHALEERLVMMMHRSLRTHEREFISNLDMNWFAQMIESLHYIGRDWIRDRQLHVCFGKLANEKAWITRHRFMLQGTRSPGVWNLYSHSGTEINRTLLVIGPEGIIDTQDISGRVFDSMDTFFAFYQHTSRLVKHKEIYTAVPDRFFDLKYVQERQARIRQTSIPQDCHFAARKRYRYSDYTNHPHNDHSCPSYNSCPSYVEQVYQEVVGDLANPLPPVSVSYLQYMQEAMPEQLFDSWYRKALETVCMIQQCLDQAWGVHAQHLAGFFSRRRVMELLCTLPVGKTVVRVAHTNGCQLNLFTVQPDGKVYERFVQVTREGYRYEEYRDGFLHEEYVTSTLL